MITVPQCCGMHVLVDDMSNITVTKCEVVAGSFSAAGLIASACRKCFRSVSVGEALQLRRQQVNKRRSLSHCTMDLEKAEEVAKNRKRVRDALKKASSGETYTVFDDENVDKLFKKFCSSVATLRSPAVLQSLKEEPDKVNPILVAILEEEAAKGGFFCGRLARGSFLVACHCLSSAAFFLEAFVCCRQEWYPAGELT
jgi:hypothetical protein